jgi:hypothetical protein
VRAWLVWGLLAALLLVPVPGASAADAPPPAGAGPAAAAPQAGGESTWTMAQLKELVGPVALYPDEVLSSLVPATCVPLDIVEAWRYVESKGGKVDEPPPNVTWDPSVVAMLQFPDVLKWMNDNLDWVQQMGDAVASQQSAVLTAIQGFRYDAQKAGNLKSDDHLKVTSMPPEIPPDTPPEAVQEMGDTQIIYIESADPEVIYVPTYEPAVVTQPYSGTAPLYGWGVGFAMGVAGAWVGASIGWGWGWGGGWGNNVDIDINNNWNNNWNRNKAGLYNNSGDRFQNYKRDGSRGNDFGPNRGGQWKPPANRPGQTRPGTRPGNGAVARPKPASPASGAGLKPGQRPTGGGMKPPSGGYRPDTGGKRPSTGPSARPSPAPGVSRPSTGLGMEAGNRAPSYGERGSASRQGGARPSSPAPSARPSPAPRTSGASSSPSRSSPSRAPSASSSGLGGSQRGSASTARSSSSRGSASRSGSRGGGSRGGGGRRR